MIPWPINDAWMGRLKGIPSTPIAFSNDEANYELEYRIGRWYKLAVKVKIHSDYYGEKKLVSITRIEWRHRDETGFDHMVIIPDLCRGDSDLKKLVQWREWDEEKIEDVILALDEEIAQTVKRLEKVYGDYM